MLHAVKIGIAAAGVCVLLVSLLLTGCGTFSRKLPPLPPDAIKPVVAVTEFENESGFSGQWKLGRGIPDLLVEELLLTERVIVVDRRNLNSVVGEIMRQGHDLFRKEDTVERGRLKNARFLIRGVITDFTQTGSATGWFRTSKVAGGMEGAKAVVMVNITVTDVESGEILNSIAAEGDANASGKWARFDYNNVSFGGEMFFKTPIGRATQAAIGKAVFSIVQSIPYGTWKARLADVAGEAIVVNGGTNYGLQEGDTFNVREESRTVTDPTTGNVVERIAGRIVGQVKITAVRETASDGVVLTGAAKRGYYLEKIQSVSTNPR